MNNFKLGFLLFLLPIIAVCQHTAQSEFQHPEITGNSLKHSFDVLKYKLNIDLFNCYRNPYSNSFMAIETVTLRIDSLTNIIRLNAVNSSLTIDSVGGICKYFTHTGDTLRIRLNRDYRPGETVNIPIFFRHNDLVDHAFYAGNGCVFFDFPPEGARSCFPCWDKPSDKAFWELTAKVPLNVKLGSNGILSDSLISGDTAYYHWTSHDQLSTYLMTISSMTNYNLDILYWHYPDHPGDSIQARFYYNQGENPSAIEAIISPMTDFYSGLFGDYPFEKIGFATLNDMFHWGGMEDQTLINLQPNAWIEGLVSHEFAHQWFGDLITCATWSDIWLNESFATYCESLWLEHTHGFRAYKDHLNIQANSYLTENPGLPVYNPEWIIHTPDAEHLYNVPIIYYKGACVLHQLRYIIGDSSFFKVLKSFTGDTNFRFKNAGTQDFIAKVKQVTGKDYSWFFDEWIYHPDHPIYNNTYDVQKSGESSWKLKLNVVQVQKNNVVFRMPINVKVYFKNKTDTLVKVDDSITNQTFEFQFFKQPASVSFDPERNILLKEAETIERFH